MTDYRWLIEAPGTKYLAVREIAHTHTFHWAADHNAALHFRTKEQADGLMMAVRQLSPDLFGFAVTLGDARAVEHAWDTWGSGQAGAEQGVLIGTQSGMAKLDQAWAEINAEGGSSHNVDVYTQGYLDAIDKALEVIEKLGGMDPLKRSKE